MQYGPFGKSTVTAKTVPAVAVAVLAVLARNIALSKSKYADALSRMESIGTSPFATTNQMVYNIFRSQKPTKWSGL